NLILRPDELVGFCVPLLRQALGGMRALRPAAAALGGPVAVLLTAAAGRLPGLAAALEENSAPKPGADAPAAGFGRALFAAPPARRGRARPRRPGPRPRPPRAVGSVFVRGAPPAAPRAAAPLLPPRPADAGPARLHFRGQDYVLCGLSFTLGRHPACDLVFD